jgi:choline dehydrogenase-like flavoprotein
METANYIIVGGGIGSCVVASRLSRQRPRPKVILIEAGPDVSDHPLVMSAATAKEIRTSNLNWKYPSIPQKHMNAGICQNGAGRSLGGGSAINGGMLLPWSIIDYGSSYLTFRRVD